MLESLYNPHDVITSYKFMLLIDGAMEVPLKSVQAFSRDNEFEPIQEGGMNDYVYLKRKPITQPFKLVVERYVPYSLGITDPLANGTEFLLPMLLFIFKGDGMAEMDTSRFYTFTGGVVMGKQYGALDAERSGLLTETITIGYNHMYCTTIPISDDAGGDTYSIVRDGTTMRHPYGVIPTQNEEHWDDIDIDGTAGTDERFKAKLWKFDGKNPKGTGDTSHNYIKRDKESDKPKQRKYSFAAENNKSYRGTEKSVRSAQNAAFSDKTLGATMGIKELTTDQMIEKSKKFALTEDGKSTGNGTLLAKRHGHDVEIGVKDMIRAAKMWAFDGLTKGGNGVQNAQNDLVTDHKNLPDGSSVGLGRPEDSKESMAEKAVHGVKNTNAGVVGVEPEPRLWSIGNGDTATKEGEGTASRQNAVMNKDGGLSGRGIEELDTEAMAAKAVHGVKNTDAGKVGKEPKPRKANLKPEKSAKPTPRKADLKPKKSKTPRARKWSIGEGETATKEGEGKASRVPPRKPELDIETMESKAHAWSIGNGGTKEGEGTASRQNAVMDKEGGLSGRGIVEQDIETMESKAHKWSIGEGETATKEGEGKASRVPPRKPELDIETMESKAHAWSIGNGGTKEGEGTASRQNAVMDKEGGLSGHGIAEQDIKTMESKAHKWSIGSGETATKEGEGTASRVPPRKPELSKTDMASKAVRNVKQSITDFLMG